MSSTFYIKNTSEAIQKSLADSDLQKLPQYTLEELSYEISKGEKQFFTKGGLEEIKNFLMKGDVEDHEKLCSDIMKLQPIVVNRADASYEIGFLLDNKED